MNLLIKHVEAELTPMHSMGATTLKGSLLQAAQARPAHLCEASINGEALRKLERLTSESTGTLTRAQSHLCGFIAVGTIEKIDS